MSTKPESYRSPFPLILKISLSSVATSGCVPSRLKRVGTQNYKGPRDVTDDILDRLTFPNYAPTNTVGSPQSMTLARHWISNCNKHHSRCKRPGVASESTWVPERLIYIDDENSRLRLVPGADVPSNASYTTLSHRWGQVKDRLVLTQSNMKEWHEQLPPLGKWKTFVDAIKISRQLQISYIWIDSLCIIQDSKDDWQHQCPQMCNIYKRSYCNIAATSAIDDTEGCFFERDVDMDLPLRLCFATEGDQLNPAESILIPAKGTGKDSLRGLYDLCKQQTWIQDIRYSPLNSRGWVLQEVGSQTTIHAHC